MRSAAAVSSAIGFSTRTCLPALSAAIAIASCCPVGVQMSTRSTSAIGEQVLEPGVTMDRSEVHDFAGRPEVAADAAPIAGQLLRIAGVDGRHRRAAEPFGGEVMDHAHEADAGDADADHCDRSRMMPMPIGCRLIYRRGRRMGSRSPIGCEAGRGR